MTKAELITSVRGLVNENSGDSGALLSDTGNLLEIIHDATEVVMLDLVPIMPGQFLTSENVTLIAGTANYTLTNSFWQIWKVEKNITGDRPIELEIIDPIEMQYHTYVGESENEPHACYFIGDTIYFVRTPGQAYANYAKVWEIRPEAATMATNGPLYIPAVAHRLIAYHAAAIVYEMMEKDPSPFFVMYARRLDKVEKIWRGRFQSQPRFVRPSVTERQGISSGTLEDYDRDW